MADDAPPVTFGVKVTRETPGHIHFNLFAGEQARGMAGSLTMRPAEFEAFLDRLKPEAFYRERPGPPGYTVIDETAHWTAEDVMRFAKAAGVVVLPWQVHAIRHYFNDRVQDHGAGGENTNG